MTFEAAEKSVGVFVSWLRLGVEAIGALVIAIGVGVAVALFARSLLSRQTKDFNRIRLTLARYLALALEFQLGADLLSTALNPDAEALARLAAVAAIRTALNFFLGREMREERDQEGPDASAQRIGTAA